MKQLVFAAAAATLLFMTSCEPEGPYPGFESRANGTWFKLQKAGAGKDTAGVGGVAFIKMSLIDSKDSVFTNINEMVGQPSLPIQFAEPKFKGDFLHVMHTMHAGDSATFYVVLDSIKKYYPKAFDLKPQYDTAKYLGFSVVIDSLYTKAGFEKKKKEMEEVQLKAQAEEQKRLDNLKQNEPALLKAYLEQNKVTAKPDAKGIIFVEQRAGQGSLITKGTAVSVRYTGRYLDGSVFDSNVLNPQAPPLNFTVGVDPMVEGFTDCMQRIRNGGKAMFILPPAQGYNDGLTRIFEVEVLVMPSNPQMPAGR